MTLNQMKIYFEKQYERIDVHNDALNNMLLSKIC